MPNWKFWEKPPEPPAPPPAAEPPRRFSAKPRTDLVPESAADPAKEEQLSRLRRHREAVLFDVEQAEQAVAPDNPWLERVGLLDDALTTVRADRERLQAAHREAGQPLPPVPIEAIQWTDTPVPTVAFRIGDGPFRYEEEIDWAERGFQLARSELQSVAGDPARLLPAELLEPTRTELLDHLTRSLFVFATDIRDRGLAGEPLPAAPTLADLAKPDVVNGGWLDWSGHSAEAAIRETELRRLEAEEQRLLTERDRELTELAKWEERLPIAERRLADVNAAIAALVGGT